MNETINYTINIDNETGTTIIHGNETGVISVEESGNVTNENNDVSDSSDQEIEEDTNLSQLNNLHENDDLCVICLSQLGEGDYTLDCNHKYHTKCIVEWFRKGNAACPLCNDNPLTEQDSYYYYGNPLINERCSLIRRKFGRKKDCPLTLKKAIDKLRELETQKKDSEKILKDFKSDPIIKELQEKGKKLRRETYKYNPKIRNQKIKIVTMMPGYFVT